MSSAAAAGLSLLRLPFPSTAATTVAAVPASHLSKPTFPVFSSASRRPGNGLLGPPPPPRAAISGSGHQVSGSYDPELRLVLELATDSELYELERILFGPSYFSPLLKSITQGADVDYAMIGEDLGERDDFLAALESRFLFLAADARSVLRGWRPSYRNVLLSVRKKLNIPCSSKLSTEDLEAEIFLHLLHEYSSEEFGTQSMWRSSKASNESNLELGYDEEKIQALAASKVGSQELRSLIVKSGSLLTLAKIYQLMPIREACHVVVQISHPSKHKLWKHALARQGTSGVEPTPVLQIVSYGSELSNRGSTFDMDLSDLTEGGHPMSYEKARTYFARDSSQKFILQFLKAKVFLLLMRWRLLARLLLQLLMVQINVVGAPCGIMDQMATACGEANKLLAMVCQPAEVLRLIEIPSHVHFRAR